MNSSFYLLTKRDSIFLQIFFSPSSSTIICFHHWGILEETVKRLGWLEHGPGPGTLFVAQLPTPQTQWLAHDTGPPSLSKLISVYNSRPLSGAPPVHQCDVFFTPSHGLAFKELRPSLVFRVLTSVCWATCP